MTFWKKNGFLHFKGMLLKVQICWFQLEKKKIAFNVKSRPKQEQALTEQFSQLRQFPAQNASLSIRRWFLFNPHSSLLHVNLNVCIRTRKLVDSPCHLPLPLSSQATKKSLESFNHPCQLLINYSLKSLLYASQSDQRRATRTTTNN